MIEIFLISLCLNNYQLDACSKAEQAWYRQSGDEQIVFDYGQKLENHYKKYSDELLVMGIVTTFAATHSYSGRLTSIKGIDIITTIGETNLLILKKSY